MRFAPAGLQLTLFVPFSYFCICWKVSPTSSASWLWLIDNSRRLNRIRLPTRTSIEFFTISLQNENWKKQRTKCVAGRPPFKWIRAVLVMRRVAFLCNFRLAVEMRP